jgi:hypothetical protein
LHQLCMLFTWPYYSCLHKWWPYYLQAKIGWQWWYSFNLLDFLEIFTGLYKTDSKWSQIVHFSLLLLDVISSMSTSRIQREWLLFNANSAISCREQVNYQWDDDEVRFILDQQAELFSYSASSLILFLLNAACLAEKTQIL